VVKPGFSTMRITMAYYIIGYDLHHDRDYTPIWNALKGWGATRLVEALWVVTSQYTAQQIRDTLYEVTGKRDTVAVVELKSGSWWATSPGVPDVSVAWLRSNIMP
jgi:hypothetical protein